MKFKTNIILFNRMVLLKTRAWDCDRFCDLRTPQCTLDATTRTDKSSPSENDWRAARRPWASRRAAAPPPADHYSLSLNHHYIHRQDRRIMNDGYVCIVVDSNNDYCDDSTKRNTCAAPTSNRWSTRRTTRRTFSVPSRNPVTPTTKSTTAIYNTLLNTRIFKILDCFLFYPKACNEHYLYVLLQTN